MLQWIAFEIVITVVSDEHNCLRSALVILNKLLNKSSD